MSNIYFKHYCITFFNIEWLFSLPKEPVWILPFPDVATSTEPRCEVRNLCSGKGEPGIWEWRRNFLMWVTYASKRTSIKFIQKLSCKKWWEWIFLLLRKCHYVSSVVSSSGFYLNTDIAWLLSLFSRVMFPLFNIILRWADITIS